MLVVSRCLRACFFSTSPRKAARRAAARTAAPSSRAPPGASVALVGRPNVGKSRLFNALVRRRLALVDGRAGTTRDVKEAVGRLGGLVFNVLDTGGMEDAAAAGAPEGRMLAHTAAAIAHGP